jgi:hypothetical protein
MMTGAAGKYARCGTGGGAFYLALTSRQDLERQSWKKLFQR